MSNGSSTRHTGKILTMRMPKQKRTTYKNCLLQITKLTRWGIQWMKDSYRDRTIVEFGLVIQTQYCIKL